MPRSPTVLTQPTPFAAATHASSRGRASHTSLIGQHTNNIVCHAEDSAQGRNHIVGAIVAAFIITGSTVFAVVLLVLASTSAVGASVVIIAVATSKQWRRG